MVAARDPLLARAREWMDVLYQARLCGRDCLYDTLDCDGTVSRESVMTRLVLCLMLVCVVHPAQSAQTGFASQHRSLSRVARVRHMNPTGVLFASPLAAIGERLCVSSVKHPEQICGVVVDVPQPEHRQWQIETGRIIEVQLAIARRLCVDPTGLPSMCPVRVWREHP
jgi:hypothetical protein